MKKTRIAILSVVLAVSTIICGFSSAYAETAIDTIMTAGTTQAFSEEAVPEADIQTILLAGLASESAINQQPWYFVAVTNRDVMKEISASGMGAPRGQFKMPDRPEGGPAPDGNMPMPAPVAGGAKASLGDSPLAIIVYMDENTASPNPNFDCGLAVQNMYLAAASLGYGTKVVTSPTMSLNGENHDAICEKLGVDPTLKAVAVLLIGKADLSSDAASGASVRNDLENKTVFVK